jgi:hypothetical protein
LVNFYLKRGYEKRGSFNEAEGENYLMMEKKLDSLLKSNRLKLR